MGVVTGTTKAIAEQREQAAGELEGAIALLGRAHKRYTNLTRELSSKIGQDLTYALDAPIILHLMKAGLGELLERKLTGEPGPLTNIVRDAHHKLLDGGQQ